MHRFLSLSSFFVSSIVDLFLRLIEIVHTRISLSLSSSNLSHSFQVNVYCIIFDIRSRVILTDAKTICDSFVRCTWEKKIIEKRKFACHDVTLSSSSSFPLLFSSSTHPCRDSSIYFFNLDASMYIQKMMSDNLCTDEIHCLSDKELLKKQIRCVLLPYKSSQIAWRLFLSLFLLTIISIILSYHVFFHLFVKEFRLVYTCLAVTLRRVADTRWMTNGERIDYTSRRLH